MLEVRLCKPALYKLKTFGWGNLNITNQWGEPEKTGGEGTKFLKFSGGKEKRGETRFSTLI